MPSSNLRDCAVGIQPPWGWIKVLVAPTVDFHIKEMLELVPTQAPKIDVITTSCKASKAGKPSRAPRAERGEQVNPGCGL